MAIHMNVFRVLADLSHMASKCILIWAIHNNRSAEGVSLLTQLLYALVFVTRYLDLLWVPPWWMWWNFFFKIFYIASSAYIVFLMMRVFARTREKEYAWKLATWSLAGSLLLAFPVCLVFQTWPNTTFTEILYTFSIILESVCVLPQLLLLRQTTVPTVIDSYYLVTLGAYRFLYILNWLLKAIQDQKFDLINLIFGIVQTALYIDFAWVYWTRQRVKLRGGGLVDGEDLRKSFLVRRFIGRRGDGNRGSGDDHLAEEDEGLARQENGTIRPGVATGARSWGPRGISVSADDPIDAPPGDGAADAHIVDPSHFEDDDDDDVDAPPPPAKDTAPAPPADDDGAISSASKWQELPAAAK